MHCSDLQKIIDLIARHELGKPVKLGCFDNAPSSSGVAGGNGSRPSSASSGAVEAECQHDGGTLGGSVATGTRLRLVRREAGV